MSWSRSANNTQWKPTLACDVLLFNAVRCPSGLWKVKRSDGKTVKLKSSIDNNFGWLLRDCFLFCFRLESGKKGGWIWRKIWITPIHLHLAALLSLFQWRQPQLRQGPTQWHLISEAGTPSPPLPPPPPRARSARRPTLFPGQCKRALNCRLTAKGKLFQA